MTISKKNISSKFLHTKKKYFILILGDNMKKLNRRGYMTIEIILASTVTFIIAFFLIDITMKLVDTTDDAYADTVLATDKALITKNIKENLEKDLCFYNGIDTVNCSDNNTCEIYFYQSGGPTEARKIFIEDNTVKYMDLEDNIIYQKKIDNNLSNIILSSNSSGNYYNFQITGENIFLGDNYDINIFVYNNTSSC